MRERRPPTDFEILKAIYQRQRDAAAGKSAVAEGILVPIDLEVTAADIGSDAPSVFGRLYYHLDPLYAPPAAPGQPRKVLFTPKAGEDVNCVNFPLLEAVLAGLWQQQRRDLLAVATAMVSLLVAVGSLIVSVAR